MKKALGLEWDLEEWDLEWGLEEWLEGMVQELSAEVKPVRQEWLFWGMIGHEKAKADIPRKKTSLSPRISRLARALLPAGLLAHVVIFSVKRWYVQARFVGAAEE